MTSASVHISNVPDDRDVERIVARQFCAQITARDLRDIGTYRRGGDVWVMVASPFTPPTPADRQAINRRVLELTNQARAHARRCGSESFPAAPPLVLAPRPSSEPPLSIPRTWPTTITWTTSGATEAHPRSGHAVRLQVEGGRREPGERDFDAGGNCQWMGRKPHTIVRT